MANTSGVVHRRRFNNNKSSIVWCFSRVNNAWLVFRQDGPNQGNVRVHNDFHDAQQDYRDRVKFICDMEAA